MKIDLQHNKGFNWFDNKVIYVKGYIFDKNNKLFKEEGLLNYFKNIESVADFETKLKEANGIFSVIIKLGSITLIATDKLRTLPLFYAKTPLGYQITDDTNFLLEKYDFEFSEEYGKEYIGFGWVSGRNTLFENIYQVQAGELVCFENDSVKPKIYIDYLTRSTNKADFETLKNSFLQILENVAKRLIEFADGRQIVIPLSGGFDSRLIAAILKKQGYENVFCFTYGKVDSYEVAISKKVSGALNYPWYFVEYNENTIPKNYLFSDEFKKFSEYQANNISVFHIQDYFAVKYLTDNKIIDADAIFAPGHTGDVMGGSNLSKTDFSKPINFVELFIEKRYDYTSKKNITPKLIEKLNKSIDQNIKKEFKYSLDDNFNIKERQAKFIVNSTKVYDFFGFKKAIPLWDNELYLFFRDLPLFYKTKRIFYEEVIVDQLYKKLNIFFDEDAQRLKAESKVIRVAKNSLKAILPKGLKTKLIKYYSRSKKVDFNNYSLMAAPFLQELGSDFIYEHEESLYTFWYVKKVKDEYFSKKGLKNEFI